MSKYYFLLDVRRRIQGTRNTIQQEILPPVSRIGLKSIVQNTLSWIKELYYTLSRYTDDSEFSECESSGFFIIALFICNFQALICTLCVAHN